MKSKAEEEAEERIANGAPRRSLSSLKKHELLAIVRTLQRDLYWDEDEDRWDAGKDTGGADFVASTCELFAQYDLNATIDRNLETDEDDEAVVGP